MRFRICLWLLLLLVVATALAGILSLPWYWSVLPALLAFVAVGLLHRAVALPMDAVLQGLFLLREQDFSSRLRLSGKPDADKITTLFNDLMDRMKAERLHILEQEKFLGKVVKVSPMGIAICNLEGSIIETNPAWEAMMTDDLAAAVRSLEVEQSHTVRLSSSQIVRITCLWFMDKGFRRRFYLAEPLTTDIIQAQKHIFNKIVRTIGHEVNNTLGSVVSVLDTLRDIHSAEPRVAEAIGASANSCHNLVRFVRSYAEIAKLPKAMPRSVDIIAFIDTLLPMLREIAGGIKLTFTHHVPVFYLRFDPVLIERVLINIVKNSVESIAAQPGGTIAIEVRENAISVTDNGRGISPYVAPRLFTPFFSTKHPDRGLGLMLISDILHAHRSTFTLRTDPATTLTTFTFTL